MEKYKNNYFISNCIKTDKIKYGFFSKEGGCSTGNYSSLNCSKSSDDKKQLVNKNIYIAKKKLGFENHYIKFLKQTHSDKVEIIDKNNLNKTIEADGSITKDKKIALAILTADCAPIFIFDSDYSFVCSLHIGWKGCLTNIINTAVYKIIQMHIPTQNLIAIIGPCLNKKNFEVDENFYDIFINKDSHYKNYFSKESKRQKIYFDIRGLINFQLQRFSIKKIINIEFDTYSNKDLFFSHRNAFHNNSLPTGRMINLIGFRDVA